MLIYSSHDTSVAHRPFTSLHRMLWQIIIDCCNYIVTIYVSVLLLLLNVLELFWACGLIKCYSSHMISKLFSGIVKLALRTLFSEPPKY